MDAVAINALNADVFVDVLKHGAKKVMDTGCAIVPEAYLKIVDEYTDWKLEREAIRRLQKPSVSYMTIEELMTKSGISKADLNAILEEETL